MHQAAVARKVELESEESAIQQKERRLRDEIIEIEQKCALRKSELDALETKHVAACRLEALGQKSDRTNVEAQLSSASARHKGYSTLLEEKRAELKSLREDRGPKDQELRELYQQEAMEKEMAEIAAETEAGMAEVNQLITLQGSLLQRIYALRQRKVNARAGKEASIKLDQAYYRGLHS